MPHHLSIADGSLHELETHLLIAQRLLYLDGTEIDFKDDVIQSGFVFKNPNATSTCGCGSSFSA